MKRFSTRLGLAALVVVLMVGLTGAAHAAQVIAIWNGGTGNWNDIANWSGGVVPSNGANTFNVLIDDGNLTASEVFLDLTVTVDNVTLDSDDVLWVNNAFRLLIAGGGVVDNAGTINLNSTGSNTYIQPSVGSLTLTGGGTLTLSDRTTNWIYQTGGGSIVNVNNTIQGAGNLGWSGAPTAITNQGTVIANGVNALSCNAGSELFTNSGTLRADSGAVLTLGGTGGCDNAFGIIEALDASTVSIVSTTIRGGTLQTTGSGAIQSGSTTSELDGTTDTVTNAGLLRVPNGQRFRMKGTINNTGTIEIGSTGTNTYIHPRDTVMTLTGGGTVTLSDATTNWIYNLTGGSLVNVDNTIQGAGNLGWSGAPTAITNQGTVIANATTNTLSCNPGSTELFTNAGTLRAANGGVLTLGNTFANTGGVIEALDASVVALSNATIDGGLLQTSGSGVFRTTSTETLDSSVNTVTNAGAIEVQNGDNIDLIGTLQNTGTISLASAGSITQLQATGGNAMLAGGGVVNMSDRTTNRIRGVAATDRIINVDNTIQGAGNIGANLSGFTNQGLVVANLTNVLLIDPSAAEDVTNAGTLRADSGATLRLGAGQFFNAGGVIEALDASVVELINATIDGGLLQTSGSGVFRTTGTETLDSSVNTVTNAGAIEVQNGDSLTLLGTLQNSGTISLNSTGTTTQMQATGGNALLAGGGVVNMSDRTTNRIRGVAATDRVINVNNTIQGAGNIGANLSGFTNQSLVVANLTNVLLIDPSALEDVTNTGTLRADNGATLRLGAGLFLNAGGVIEALDTSAVELINATIDGGLLQTSGSGVFRTTGIEALDSSVNPIILAGALEVRNGDSLNLIGTLQNSGTISLNSTGATTQLQATGGNVMLAGGGMVNLGDATTNRIRGAAATDRVINVNNTIQGAGNIGANLSGFTNQSLVVANLTNVLLIDPSAAEDVTNAGTLRADNGATLRLGAGQFFNAGGVIEALDASVVELINATIDGGLLQTSGSGVFRTTGIETLDSSVNPIILAGALEVRNGDSLNLLGTLQNSGTISLNSTGSTTQIQATGGNALLAGGGVVNMGDAATNRIRGLAATDRVINVDNTIQGAGNIGANISGFTNQGTVIASGTVALIIDPATLEDFTNEGILQATGTGGLTLAAGPFTTSGAVTAAVGSSITRTGDYTQTAGSTTVDGTLSATGIVDIQGGILAGSGTVLDDVTNAGSVQPGTSAGVLTIDANYTQDAAGQLAIEIGGLALGTQYDQLAVTGIANLDGTLKIDFIGGFPPVVGDSFVVMTYASHTGTFSAIDVPCMPAGEILQVSVLDTSVVVQVSGALIGDADCDCALSLFDVDAFVLALTDPVAYQATYTNCVGLNNVDMNGDTVVNGLDIQPFVDAFIP